MAKFKSQERPGFSITFDNNWTISVQWHTGAYCERKMLATDLETIMDRLPAESPNAEIAIWDEAGRWYRFDNADTVLGYVTPDELAEWIARVRNFTP